MLIVGEPGSPKIIFDFAIIGAQKAATTALFEMLRQHPDLFMAPTKEDNFFAFDEAYARGDEHLSIWYGGATESQLVGHVYVNLMYFSEIAVPRMLQHNPGMKIIALLRNPVDRAYSAYHYARMRGWERAATFEEAISNEEEGRVSSQFAHRGNLTYLAHGHYSDQLQLFVDAFGRDSVNVFFQDDLRSDPNAVCSAIFKSLGVSSSFNVNVKSSVNAAGTPRVAVISSMLVNDSSIKSLYKRLIPYRWRHFISRKLIYRLQALNQREQHYAPLKSETRAWLESYYKPHNERLQQLIGRSF